MIVGWSNKPFPQWLVLNPLGRAGRFGLWGFELRANFALNQPRLKQTCRRTIRTRIYFGLYPKGFRRTTTADGGSSRGPITSKSSCGGTRTPNQADFSTGPFGLLLFFRRLDKSDERRLQMPLSMQGHGYDPCGFQNVFRDVGFDGSDFNRGGFVHDGGFLWPRIHPSIVKIVKPIRDCWAPSRRRRRQGRRSRAAEGIALPSGFML